MSDHGYGVKVKTPGATRAKWLTPNGGLTVKRIHALTTTQKRASEIAVVVAEDNPDVVTEAKAAAL